jgi:NADH-quinone oxidoreductase subunit N
MTTSALLPEAVVLGSAVALLAASRVLPYRYQRWLGAVALILAIGAFALELWLGAAVGTLLNGAWQQDRFALFAKASLLLGLIMLIAPTLDSDMETESRPLPAVFVVVLGGMVAASSLSLWGLWAGLVAAALAAIAADVLSSDERSTRLLLVAVIAAALTAVGLAAIYATTGDASLSTLRNALRPGATGLPLAVAVLLTLAGLVVLSGIAPLRWLMPEGGASRTPLGAGALGGLLLGVAAVVAARLLGGLGAVNLDWAPWLAVLAALAMVLGGVLAVAARSPRAAAAWLVVVQVGWLAAGLALHDRRGSAGALLVLGGLLLAAAALPALAGAEEAHQLAALRRNEPLRALGLTLLLLSLAGAPPLAGFIGQFAVAAELVRSNTAWLLAAGLLGSLLSLFAAFRVVRLVYLEAGPEQRPGRGQRAPARSWSPGALVPAIMVLLFTALANPISGLALQGAAALKLP